MKTTRMKPAILISVVIFTFILLNSTLQAGEKKKLTWTSKWGRSQSSDYCSKPRPGSCTGSVGTRRSDQQ